MSSKPPSPDAPRDPIPPDQDPAGQRTLQEAASGWTRANPWGRQPGSVFIADAYAAPSAHQPRPVSELSRPATPVARPNRVTAPDSSRSVLSGSVLPMARRAAPRPAPSLAPPSSLHPASVATALDARPTGALDMPPPPSKPIAREPVAPEQPNEAQAPFEVSLPPSTPRAQAAPSSPSGSAQAASSRGSSPLEIAEAVLAPAASAVGRATARRSTRRRRTLLIAGGAVAAMAIVMAVLLMTRPDGEPERTGILPAPAEVAPSMRETPRETAPVEAAPAPLPPRGKTNEPAPTPPPVQAQAPRPVPVQTPPAQATPLQPAPAQPTPEPQPEPILIPVEPLIPVTPARSLPTDPDAPVVTRPPTLDPEG